MGGEFQKIGAGGGGIEVGFVGESETVRVSVIKFLDWVGLGGVPVRMRRLGGGATPLGLETDQHQKPRVGFSANPGLRYGIPLG